MGISRKANQTSAFRRGVSPPQSVQAFWGSFLKRRLEEWKIIMEATSPIDGVSMLGYAVWSKTPGRRPDTRRRQSVHFSSEKGDERA